MRTIRRVRTLAYRVWDRAAAAVPSPRARAVILTYHRIGETTWDPFLLSVTPLRFEAHLEYLQRNCTVIPLVELAARVAEGRVPPRAVALTFDDGYADTLSLARLSLERRRLPATVFVTTGAVGSNREYWWDELARLFEPPAPSAHTVVASIGGRVHAWRHDRAFGALRRHLHHLSTPEHEKVLDQIKQQTRDGGGTRATYRPLSERELRALSNSPLLDVGAHTVRHLPLRALSVATQALEILESRRYLERSLERPVTSFAYPFGGRIEVAPKTRGLVREAGFQCACSTVARPVTRRSDPFWLPRVTVRDWGADEFAARVEACFSGSTRLQG